MQVVGIIAEYNPLHKGHIYHMEQAVRKSAASYTVVVMSGNFVQRGEPACIDKYTRAQWAVEAGADIVFELPSVFANANAQMFAEGAVRLLTACKIVTDLAFGCEQSSLQVLQEISEITSNEPPEFKALLRSHMKSGKSYPRARYDTLQDLGVGPSALAEIVKPNNILALEYLRSLKKINSHMQPLPIERIGSSYSDTVLSGEFSSASAIRDAFKSGKTEVLDLLPLFVGGAIKFDTQFPLTLNDIGPMMLYKIRSMSNEDFLALPDVTEGLDQAFIQAAKTEVDADSLFESVKSKRYTLARCKRIGVSALLGITSELQNEMLHQDNLYFRVLAMKKDARALLSAIAALSKVPIILRNSDCYKISDIAKRSMAIDALSTDIMAYALQKKIHRDHEAAILL